MDMITESDKLKAKELARFISSFIGEKTPQRQWQELSGFEELVHRMVHNLEIAPHSYRPVTKENAKQNYYTAQCDVCGWWGGSNLLGGGGPIADTGDYGDCYCPVCLTPDPSEK